MKRAIILTGALRTIRKTMKYLKRNVLCNICNVCTTQCTHNENRLDVYACIQNDTAKPDEEWTAWFRQEIGESLREITWFSLDRYPAWVAHRDLQLEHLTITEGWKGYLRNSGSMIEYFQLQLAYMKMCYMESKEGFRYDYIIRARTDSIYAKPVDFHWLSWSEEEVEERLIRIKEEMKESELGGNTRDVLRYFMCTVISDDLIPNLSFLSAEYVPSALDRVDRVGGLNGLNGLNGLDQLNGKSVRDYLHQGRYILTIRKNNLYVVRRDLFHLIPTLGTMYGFMRSPIADDYWFNAEGQFRDACYYSCLSIFEYSTAFEEKSLVYPHQWNEANFFDLNFECIHPRMLYCVVRK